MPIALRLLESWADQGEIDTDRSRESLSKVRE